MRLIDYLLETGLAADARSANGLIMRGDVLVADVARTSPAFEVAEGQTVRLRGDTSGAVSRGLHKIAPVLKRSAMNVVDRVCLDLGVSTGGFTQALLEAGAARIYAVDVAYGVTALSIRDDPRVILLERTNARELSAQQIPVKVERVVGDLSFISWRAVLPAILTLLADDAELLLLVKPQFELAAAGQAHRLTDGVAADSRLWREALLGLYELWSLASLEILGVYPSALAGARGNREFFVHLRKAGKAASLETYTAMLDQAIEECAP